MAGGRTNLLARAGAVEALYAALGRVRARLPRDAAESRELADAGGRLGSAIDRLGAEVREGRYRPEPPRRFSLPKPGGGRRPIAAPTVKDRVVLEALRATLAPVVEPRLHASSYAYRPGRSALDAAERLTALLSALGREWVLDADIESFFDRVPHERVIGAVEEWLGPDETGIVRLVERFVRAHSLEARRGLLQGSALSPLLSNLYLDPVDRALERAGFAAVRYCDNIACPAADRAGAERARGVVEGALGALGLNLHPKKTNVVAIAEGFTFLGYRFDGAGRSTSEGAVQALVARVAALPEPRVGGRPSPALVALVRGWSQYFGALLPAGAALGPHGDAIRAGLDELVSGSASRRAATHDPRPGEAEARTARPDDSAITAEPTALAVQDDDDGPVCHWLDELPGGDASDDGQRVDDEASGYRDDAERRVADGDFRGAEAAYAAALDAEARADANGATPSVSDSGEGPSPLEPAPEEEDLEQFCGLFRGRDAAFAEAIVGSDGRLAYEVVARPLDLADVDAHLAGRMTLAVHPRRDDGRTLLGVLDVDDRRTDEGIVGGGRASAVAYGLALAHLCREHGVPPLLEDSGAKGLHLWFPLSRAVPADAVHAALHGLVATFPPPPGVGVEVFPAPDGAPDVVDQVIKLPLGIHPIAGRRCELLAGDGRPIPTPLAHLFAIPLVDPDILVALGGDVRTTGFPVPSVTRSVPSRADASSDDAAPPETAASGEDPRSPFAAWEIDPSVRTVLDRCGVLARLVAKAAVGGYLEHAERLSLLWTLGHIGEGGRATLHEVMRRCHNYSVDETERQLKRLRGVPMGCQRLREKHGAADCRPEGCAFRLPAGAYATPLLHATPFRREWRKGIRRASASLRAWLTGPTERRRGARRPQGASDAEPAIGGAVERGRPTQAGRDNGAATVPGGAGAAGDRAAPGTAGAPVASPASTLESDSWPEGAVLSRVPPHEWA